MVVKALVNHAGVVGVQEHGCWALAILALNADNQVEIERQGGNDAVVKAMENHFGSVHVQEFGIWALMNAGWSQQSTREKAHVIDLVLHAMAATNATARTREYGMLLLPKLSRD